MVTQLYRYDFLQFESKSNPSSKIVKYLEHVQLAGYWINSVDFHMTAKQLTISIAKIVAFCRVQSPYAGFTLWQYRLSILVIITYGAARPIAQNLLSSCYMRMCIALEYTNREIIVRKISVEIILCSRPCLFGGISLVCWCYVFSHVVRMVAIAVCFRKNWAENRYYTDSQFMVTVI